MSVSLQGGLPAYGIKVARGAVSDGGAPGSFYAWNGSDWSTPALPTGFDKNQMAKFLPAIGPQVHSLFAAEASQGSTLNTYHFSVGYDANRQMFISVEQYADSGGVLHTRIRLSTDIVNWSPATDINVTGTNVQWANSLYNYPEFANSTFDSNTALDAANLYVLGTSNNGVLSFVRFHLN